MQYASPTSKSAVVDSLEVVILGATEIDTDFNVKALYDACYVIYSCSTHIRRDVS